jgi:hypothetical protein
MEADKYDKSSTIPSYSNLSLVECRLDELTKSINAIRDYDNPYQYIIFIDNDTMKSITAEITPKLLSLPNELIQNQIAKWGNKSGIIQAILSRYSILDHEKRYKLTKDIPVETKLNMLYAESISYARNYCTYSLPSKYSQIFRENGYRNIYEKVKDELLTELNELINRKIELLTSTYS